jgi:hypothetical protein
MPQESPAGVSRRSVLRGAAGAGAVGLAAAGGVATVAAATRQDHPARQDAAAPAGPVMVYLRDASTGEMEVFAGTGQTSLRDPALARELMRAIQ